MTKADYQCDKCHAGHTLSSTIGKAHYIYRVEIPEWGYRTIICMGCGKKTTVKKDSSQYDKRLCGECHLALVRRNPK